MPNSTGNTIGTRGGSLLPLIGKEITEQLRTYKVLIAIAVFVTFGILSPVAAKYTAEIVRLATAGSGQSFQITIPAPRVEDALIQFVKNLSQIGLFVFILITMGSVAEEKERGTAAFLLVKPVSRTSFILAKFTAFTFTILVAMLAAATVCGFYTAVLFGELPLGPFLTATGLVTLYILAFTALTLLFSALFPGQAAAGVLSFLVWILLSIASGFGTFGRYSPGALAGEANAAALGMMPRMESLIGAVVLVVVSVIGAVLAFRGWED